MNCRLFLIILILFFSNCTFSKIYTSEPFAGGNIEVLVEDANCTIAEIIDPNAQRYSQALDANGQLVIEDASSGEWSIICADERANLLVLSAPGDIEQKKDAGLFEYRMGKNVPVFFVGGLLFVIIALAAAGAAVIALEPAPRKMAFFSKKRNGKTIRIRFFSGSRHIKNIYMIDDVGPQWEGEKMKMNAKKLAAHHSLEMQYEYEGEIGKASVAWEEESEKICLKICGEETVFAKAKESEFTYVHSAKARKKEDANFGKRKLAKA
ncbi:MAG: hypothetical protein WC492_04675 [Candidatus Micrarchaeia archaeon]